ncbi:phosphoribosyl-AMP cyclohydrolase [Thermoproteus uzoniensis 768-20]|uniref:Phosphoribosyl-AMP cyclohydrolase n=1 Tax=Thermoproteus uzoniensis (strain 768-20) TaxID=999630 RepID=F2L424_THEU7|nr:phosphoribosyl-AMP cyclohydrolase [Thermoproteus uzoniensis]AEA12080.1 phosphoribosyl-AMP cyclohydrolase [Thermoproteus uzoniensis 768-20]
MEPRPLAPADEAWRIAAGLNYRQRDGTVIAVVQDVETGEVLMVAHMDPIAVFLTLVTGLAHYWSTSRRRLWLKGETSGHYQYVVEFRTDCDGDAVLLKVVQIGAACHTGSRSCFGSKYSRLLPEPHKLRSKLLAD